MYELIKLTDKCYYIQSPAKIGVYKCSVDEVYLIDSGSDKDAGRKVRQILDSNGWTLKAIFNTHSNADHIGGNKYLQSQTNCKIYAPSIECDFSRHPILEPAFLYGAKPYNELCHKFLMAQESDINYLSSECMPNGLEIVELKGHFFDMVGFKTDDGVAFIADCLASKNTIDKYGVSFVYDIEEYLKTLERIKSLDAKIFVPSHADVTTDINDLAQYNIDKTNEIAERIVAICKEPISFETILQKIFTCYNLKMTHEQHVLIGSTIKSYLTYLKNQNRVNAFFENNTMLWKAE